ncbi:FKBP-type peptidyl-prolyl cis-trans isomerase [Rubrivirga sp. IMCC45206]|uniref:FKBP-type peptidyl-prolyl cis-trans isomerase n=1 Tax=Rubrivirga sp. IMCC45206 TaxID=3391614 RepID=UPI0039901DE5
MSPILSGRTTLPLLLGLLLATAACDSGETVAEANSRVVVSYVGTLADGTVFDQNPRATFTLDSSLISGFRNAVIGMSTGETRTFDIPPEDAYGAAGRPPAIPPDATLTFQVTLLDIL